MLDRILAILAMVILIIFLGILWWKVPRTDLGVIIIATLVLALWDLITGALRGRDRR